MNLEKKIDKYYNQFKTKKREGEDETIVVFKDNVDKKLEHSVFKAHGDRLPDDWIFDTYHSILGCLADYDIEKEDDIDENRSEIVDGLVDIYTSDLTSWLNNDNRNVYYLTEAQEEYGEEKDGFNLLMMAQYKAIDEIFGEVENLLTD